MIKEFLIVVFIILMAVTFAISISLVGAEDGVAITELVTGTKADLEGVLSDVSDIAEADGDIYTGTHDFSGATLIMVASDISSAFSSATFVVAVAGADTILIRDQTDNAVKKALLLAGGAVATADITDVSVTQTEFAELETIDATTISTAQWTGLGGATTAGIALWDDADAAAQLVTLGLTATASEINTPLDGASVTLTEFQELETIEATTISANQWAMLGGVAETLGSAELNILDGVTGVTATELGYIGDVTSLIQAQIDLKAPLASPTFSGTVTADGLTLGANENITLGAQTLDHNGTDFVFSDNINVPSVSGPPDYWEVTIDSANGLTADTTWFKQNFEGGTVTIDSIYVAASADNYAVTFFERDYAGGNVNIVDVVTASTNGVAMFYIAETTISHATIEVGNWIGILKPVGTAKNLYVRIHYDKP